MAGIIEKLGLTDLALQLRGAGKNQDEIALALSEEASRVKGSPVVIDYQQVARLLKKKRGEGQAITDAVMGNVAMLAQSAAKPYLGLAPMSVEPRVAASDSVYAPGLLFSDLPGVLERQYQRVLGRLRDAELKLAFNSQQIVAGAPDKEAEKLLINSWKEVTEIEKLLLAIHTQAVALREKAASAEQVTLLIENFKQAVMQIAESLSEPHRTNFLQQVFKARTSLPRA